MHKIFVLIISFCMAFGLVSTQVEATDSMNSENVIDIMDVLENPEDYPNTEIVFLTAQEMIEKIKNDPNISTEKKESLINEISHKQLMRGKFIDYAYLREVVEINTSYKVSIDFYTAFEYYDGDVAPTRMLEILHVSLNRAYYGGPKLFSGSIYYKLIAGNRLAWEIDGDFYNTGTLTTTGGVSIGVGESTKVSFQVSYSNDYYAYVHKSGEYRSAAMIP